jgi:hypothetical protein
MQLSSLYMQIVFAAALVSVNGLSSNVKPQEITRLVSQGIAQHQVIATMGPSGG